MSGSSPLAWGILIEFVSSTGRLRFILTRVGYTWDIAWIFSHTAVHPHSRGVYVKSDGLIVTLSTVHPHSRGVYAIQKKVTAQQERFIPTRVGYTFLLLFATLCRTRFIPTRVGYTKNRYRKRLNKCGSSPLAWGIRITIRWFCRLFSGSSPLAWGILVHPCVQHIIHRFIPTRVGYTCPGRIPWL